MGLMRADCDLPNPTLLERIPLTARVVLDVGCGTGALGAEYKRRNPAARYLGVDRDPVAAAVAARHLDDVALLDLDVDTDPFTEVVVDCLIFGDSLEHFRDPWKVLATFTPRLSNRGVLLICMPNLEHWSFADRLLRGLFEYEDSGLFDRTHLRWFTEATTRRAILQAALVPRDVVGRVFDLEAARRFVAMTEPALRRLGVDPHDYLRRCAPLQHVWRAIPQTREEELVIVSTMMNPVGGLSEVRVREPLAALATNPKVTAVVLGSEPVRLDQWGPEVPKVFIYHRPSFDGGEDLEAVRRLIDAGWVVVCDFDDNPDFIEGLKGKEISNFQMVQAVQTSTEPLAEVLRARNPEVQVFANAISRLPDPRNFERDDHITLFFGALNREADWAPYMGALNAVARIAGDRLSFHVVHDRRFFDALETTAKIFTPLCDHATYLSILEGCEASFLPLRDTPFNRCKSDLKAIEASARRVVCLASDLVYGAWMEDGRTGLIFTAPSELQHRLARLVADPQEGRVIAEAARAVVIRDRMLGVQIDARIEWYRSLWRRKEALDVRWRERWPRPATLDATAGTDAS